MPLLLSLRLVVMADPAKPNAEQTSAEIASLASRGLVRDDLTPTERKRVYASALTQAANKPRKKFLGLF